VGAAEKMNSAFHWLDACFYQTSSSPSDIAAAQLLTARKHATQEQLQLKM
jgi:hypothetical protein